jgi:isopenicillin N synthase-like dioxygenase
LNPLEPAPSASSIAVVDLPRRPGERADDDAWRHALHAATVAQSTFQLREHGAEVAVDDMLALAREFFASPPEERRRMAAQGPQASGYHAGSGSTEVLAVTRTGGRFEDDSASVVAAMNERSRRVLERYFTSMLDVARTVLEAMATGLGLDANALTTPFADGAVENVQIRHYCTTSLRDHHPLDPHTDPPPLTIIAQDDVGGLESLVEDTWLPVSPVRGALVVQVGEVMARWTAHRYAPSRHRVKSVDGTERLSLVYNLLPRMDLVIDCLSGLRGGESKGDAAPVSVAAFLDAWLRRTRGYSTKLEPTSGEPSAPEETSPETAVLTEQLRDALGRARLGDLVVVSAGRTEHGLRLDLQAAGEPLILEVEPCVPGKRYFRTARGLGFWYRGRIRPELTQPLEHAVHAMAPALARWLEA